MIIDCIGCLHGHYPKLDGGDLLIITGDLTASDKPSQYLVFRDWLQAQEYKKKVFISGNHDTCIENGGFYSSGAWLGADYLCDSGTEFEGLKIWGSPWSLSFKEMNPCCAAYTKVNEDLLMDRWDRIPQCVDILITHTPAFGVRDAIEMEDGTEHHKGSRSLYAWLKYVERPKLHVFSHIHEGYGTEEHFASYDDKMMLSVNCSIMNGRYQPVNAPIRIVL